MDPFFFFAVVRYSRSDGTGVEGVQVPLSMMWLFVGLEISSGPAGVLLVFLTILLDAQQTGNGAAVLRSIPAFIWSEFRGRFSDSLPELKLGRANGL